jgi:NAD(P)-dependent dehydrogenase (short-subunit alcohol dehydrogenase family)
MSFKLLLRNGADEVRILGGYDLDIRGYSMSIADFSLKSEVALITGGRRGIGKTLALAFAEAGADVAVSDFVVDDGQLEDVAGQIRQFGRNSLAIRADTRCKADVDAMVQQVIDQFGVIDILVNNAGVDVPGPIVELSEEGWDKVINTNLKGCFICAQVAAKRMVERKKGNIISIASQFAFRAGANMGVYCISKAGVVMLTRVLAQELAAYGIRANAIAPAMIKTDLNRHRWSDPEFMKQYEPTVPLGRVGETTDIAGAAIFLASKASSYVTGHTLLVEGGRLA